MASASRASLFPSICFRRTAAKRSRIEGQGLAGRRATSRLAGGVSGSGGLTGLAGKEAAITGATKAVTAV